MWRPTLFFKIAFFPPKRRLCLRGKHQHNATIALTQSNMSGVTPTHCVLEVSYARRFHQVIIFYCSVPLCEGVVFLSGLQGWKLHNPLHGFWEPVQLIKQRVSFFLHFSHKCRTHPEEMDNMATPVTSHLVYCVLENLCWGDLAIKGSSIKKKKKKKKNKRRKSTVFLIDETRTGMWRPGRATIL